MLDEALLAKINEINATLNPLQKAWVSGFLWGQVQAPSQNLDFSHNALMDPIKPNAVAYTPPTISVISASQTGNARALADQLVKALIAAQHQAKHIHSGDYKFKDIAKETHIILIASTQGEGDAPEETIGMYKFLHSKKAPTLAGIQTAVFGIGDSSYENFCQTGKDFHQAFVNLNATVLVDSVFADIDYQPDFEKWSSSLLQTLNQQRDAAVSSQSTAMVSLENSLETQASENAYTRHQPYEAQISVVQKITSRDSDKDVRHIEIDLGDANFPYTEGDAVGVYYENPEAWVNEVLQLCQLNPEEKVVVAHQDMPIKQALISHLELSPNHPKFVEFYANKTANSDWLELIQTKSLVSFASNTPILAMLRQNPIALTAAELIEHLRPLTPRSYSIASSQALVGNELHITVGHVTFEKDQNDYFGSASHFLCELSEEDLIKIFLEKNPNFRLPENSQTPMIMIGAGTGVAPFRSFIQGREAQQESGLDVGENWLIFGNPKFTDDFLYQAEWQRYVKAGVLTDIDLAWSRDQSHKVYVSHKIIEQGQKIWAWLQKGAHIYVCGDANKMAKDVEAALLQILQTHAAMDEDRADEYLTELRIEKKYQRDVY